MNSIEKKKQYNLSPWMEDGYQYKGVVHYGMHYIYGNRQPHFSITADTYRQKNGRGRWVEDAFGCQHDLIAKRARKLRPLIQFHLHSQDGLPMHYLENAWYWYQGSRGWRKTHLGDYKKWTLREERLENWKFFCKHILLEEHEKLPKVKTKDDLIEWLKSRTDRLKERFDETMSQFEVEYIDIPVEA
jgi:hypothetical protein